MYVLLGESSSMYTNMHFDVIHRHPRDVINTNDKPAGARRVHLPGVRVAAHSGMAHTGVRGLVTLVSGLMQLLTAPAMSVDDTPVSMRHMHEHLEDMNSNIRTLAQLIISPGISISSSCSAASLRSDSLLDWKTATNFFLLCALRANNEQLKDKNVVYS